MGLINFSRKNGLKWAPPGPWALQARGAQGPWAPRARGAEGPWALRARGARGPWALRARGAWGPGGPSGPVGPKLGLKWFEKFQVKLKHCQISQKLFLKWSKIAILFEKMPFDHQ